MKAFDQRANRKLVWWFVALICFLPFTGIAQDDTNDFSWLKLIPPGCCLDSWSFDETNLYTDFGFAPLSFTNIEQVPDWDGEALQVDSTNAAWLTYGIVEDAAGYGEWTNLTLDTGTIEFWFMPNWQSNDTNFFGSGPGDWGRLIEAGSCETKAENDWWSLYLNPSGTGIYFSSGTNGVRTNYLGAPISWDWNTWHMINLTYSRTNTALYIDGQLAATGSGVRYVPGGDPLTNGFAIGSDFATGMQQAHGQFDDLATYNYQLSADDVAEDYAETYPELPGTFHAMDDESMLPPGGTNDDGGGGGDSFMPDYGTNLWVALEGMTNGTLSLLETNTISDVLYELQGCTNLASPNWVSFGFVTGSELTNCTPAVAPVGNNGATFYRVRSWQGVDGIPFWWFLTYLGQDTNVSGEMFSPSGDGWTLLQCFDNGLNPTNWVTPPAPQGLTITSYNTNGTATLSWMLSAGPVQGYIVQTPSGTNIVGGGLNSYSDNSSSSSASYSISAIYGGGLSAWSPSVSVSDFLSQQSSGSEISSIQNVAFADFVPGQNDVTYLALGGIPTNAATVRLEYIDFNDGLTLTNDIPVGAITNGLYEMPSSWSSPSDYGDNMYDYAALVQTIDGSGNASSLKLLNGYLEENWLTQWNWSLPYFDGREQLKENLNFLLREPISSPFRYIFSFSSVNILCTAPTNYVYASLYDTSPSDSFEALAATNEMDEFLPFEENYLYRNFVFSEDGADTNGAVTNGVAVEADDSYHGLTLFSPIYQFQEPTEETNIPALLATNEAQWLISYPLQAEFEDYSGGVFYDLSAIGVTYYIDGNRVDIDFHMANNSVNYFGLPLESPDMTYVPGDSNGDRGGNYETNLLVPNSTFSVALSIYGDGLNTYPYFYVQAAQPEFQTVGYCFWRPEPTYFASGGSSAEYFSNPLPGNPGFEVTNKSDVLITSVGDTGFQVAGYAKLAVTNSVHPGVYGYLGQYFTNAYRVDSSGNVTTNVTGALSPYGQFFATQPGQAALVTMPDPDTGQQGTGVVDVIALNVDANHDGTMDFSFTGPDFVGPNDPYRFWVNDDQDAGDDSGDGVPGQPVSVADGYNYTRVEGSLTPHYYVHGTRDLVDFFPVYVNIGSLFVSNSLSADISYTDTNWQFVLSQSDEVLRFAYTDLTPTNYMNSLRDTNEARLLGGFPGLESILPGAQLTTISNVADGGAPLSPSFIASVATNDGGIILIEAATNTTQPLVLTIYHGTNQIAQTSLDLSISGVEQMFRHKNILLNPQPNEVPDRLTDEQVPNEPPTNDKNLIFVHGYNVNATQARGWDSDYFKRLYWSGSHAKFYGVTWESADSQKAGAVTINLETNIVNAFNTAPLLNNFINGLSGTNIIASHSLGNILVLSTLNDCTNRNINSYFMIDAALAIEAIDTNAVPNPDMYPSVWTSYDTNLWASYWYGLFPANDYRSTLTWRGRLTNFQNAAVYNFIRAARRC